MKDVLFRMAVCLALMLALAGAAVGASVSDSQTIPLESPPWDYPIVLDKFDSSLGNLTKITFELDGTALGDAGFENQSLAGATVNMQLSAVITLLNGGSTLVQVIPLVANSSTVDAYDGTVDYSGPGGSQTTGSGRLFTGLTNSQWASVDTTNPADFAAFTAGFPGDTITLHITSTANNNASSPDTGNISYYFATEAMATGKVTYVFDAVPEPSGLLAIFTGLSGLVGLAVRRRK